MITHLTRSGENPIMELLSPSSDRHCTETSPGKTTPAIDEPHHTNNSLQNTQENILIPVNNFENTVSVSTTHPYVPSSTSHPPNLLMHSNIRDNTSLGDSMKSDKLPNTIRIYFQNVNGINKNNWINWKEPAKQTQLSEIDVFGCAETNISLTEATRKYAQQMIKSRHKQANLSVANSAEVGTTDYQPGGRATCITGKYTGSILKQIIDPSELGRWSGHMLRLTHLSSSLEKLKMMKLMIRSLCQESKSLKVHQTKFRRKIY
jgi:hypothetical protein